MFTYKHIKRIGIFVKTVLKGLPSPLYQFSICVEIDRYL